MVYVEYVIMNNLLANSFICAWTAKVSGVLLSKRRIFAVSAIASIFGVIFPTVKTSQIVCLLIKIVSALFLTFLITGLTSVKRYLITLLLFYGISFCLGGTVSALLNALSFSGNVNYSEEELTFCIMGGGVIFVYIAKQTLAYIKSRADKGCVTVYFESKKSGVVALEGFIDSGNEVLFEGVGVNFIPIEYKEKLNYKKTDNFISVTTTAGNKIFQIYKLPYVRFSDGISSQENIPVVFWKSDEKQKRVILHSRRS